MSNSLIAIDPGSSGCICHLKESGETFTHKMPDTPKDLLELLRSIQMEYVNAKEIVPTCFMEKVQGLPGMGGSPMFNFGLGYGHLEMALIALEIKTVTTRPQEWQKVFGIGTKGKSSTTEWKNKLKAKCQQIYPHIKVTLWNADALLIGEWARNLRNK